MKPENGIAYICAVEIQHIFFDLDNTLWDYRHNAYLALNQIFTRERIQDLHGISFEEFHREYYTVNENLWSKIRDKEIDKAYLRKHRFYDTFQFFGIDDLGLSQFFENTFLSEILNFNDLVEGAAEILEYLMNKGFTMHILSNGFGEETLRKCENSGIKKFFSTITSADDIGIRKPQPEIYAHALKKANALKTNSIMIGDDWIADIEGAVAFGIRAIFFDRFNDDFDSEIPTIKKLDELKNFF